jgi:hypothetical protein
MIRPTLRVSGTYRATVRIRHDVDEHTLAYCAAEVAWDGNRVVTAETRSRLVRLTRAEVERQLRQSLSISGDPQSWPDDEWPEAVFAEALDRVCELWPEFRNDNDKDGESNDS